MSLTAGELLAYLKLDMQSYLSDLGKAKSEASSAGRSIAAALTVRPTLDVSRIRSEISGLVNDVQQLHRTSGQPIILNGDTTRLRSDLEAAQRQLDDLRRSAATPIRTSSASSSSAPRESSGGGITGGDVARLAAYTAGFVGLGRVIGSTYQQTADYETEIATFGATTKTTGAQLQAVSALALKLGADTSIAGANAADAAETMTELAKGGLSVAASMTAAKGTLQLASAAQVDFATAAGIQTAALNSFGLGADQAAKVADTLANTANAASGEITDFAEGMKQSGSVAHGFGMTLLDNQTILAQFANEGIKGSMGGNILKSALLSLERQSGPSGKAIEQLGIKVKDSNGQYITAAKLEQALADAKKRMGTAAYNQAAAVAFGTRGVIFAGVAADNGAKGYEHMQTAITNGAGAAAFSEAKMSGLGGAVKNLQNQFETAQVVIGEHFSKALQGTLNFASAAIPKITSFFTGGGAGKGLASIGDFFQPLVTGAGDLISKAWPYVRSFGDQLGTVWSNIQAGIKPVVDAIGTFLSTISKNGTIDGFGAGLHKVGDAAIWLSQGLKPLGGLIADVFKWLGNMNPVALQAGAALLLIMKYGSGVPALLTKIGSGAKTLGSSLAKGGALAAAVATISSIADQFKEISQNQKDVTSSTITLTQALVENNGKWSDQIISQQKATVAGTSQFQTLISNGANYGDTMDFLTGKTNDFAKILAEVGQANGGQLPLDVINIMKWAQGMNQSSAAAATAADHQLALAASAKSVATVLKAAAAAEAEFGAKAGPVGTAAIIAQGALAKVEAFAVGAKTGLIGAGSAAVTAGAALASINTGSLMSKAKQQDVLSMNNLINNTSAVADSATAAISGLSDAVDILTGRDVPLEDAQKNLNAQILAIAQAFKDAKTATKGQVDQLVSAKGAIDTTTKAGQDLYDSVTSYKGAYDTAVIAGEKAAGANASVAQQVKGAQSAADSARAAFIKQATSMGLSRDEADKLADHMGILEGKKLTPKVLHLSAQDAASAVVATVNALKVLDKQFRITAVVDNIAGIVANAVASIPFLSVPVHEQLVGPAVNPAHKAGGGTVTGGIQGIDSVPTVLMPGEEVIRTGPAQRFRGLLKAINSGAMGMAGGGTVPGVAALAGVGAAQLGDRQGNVVSALADLAQTLTDMRSGAANDAGKQHDAQVQYNADHDAQIRADQAYLKSKTAANLQDKKTADAQAAASARTLANAKVVATVSARNVADTASVQKNMQGAYRTLQATAARYDSITTALGNARSSLAQAVADRASAAASISSSVAGYDGGITGHSDVRGTAASVIGGLKFNLSKVTGFNADIAKLKKEGIRPDLLSQLISGFGSGGEITAHALAMGSVGDIRSVNSIQASLVGRSNAVGALGAGAQYDPTVKAFTAQVSSLAKQQAAANAAAVRLATADRTAFLNAVNSWSFVQNDNATWKAVQRVQKNNARRG